MRYQDLRVWQEANALTVLVFRATERLPASERYGLSSQMRRAARSVAANIAEGFGKGFGKDYARFLGIATGSLFELEGDLDTVARFGWISSSDADAIKKSIVHTSRLLHALRARVRKTK